MRHKRPATPVRYERFWVLAEVRPPGTNIWRPMGLFVLGTDAADARAHFREETGRRTVRKILRVTSAAELLGRVC